MLQTRNLTKSVVTAEGELTILQNINLSVKAGESLAIVGPSGSGKSTLLGLLAGLELPSSGQVFMDGEDLTALDEEGRAALRARLVAFVFQSFHLLPSLSAFENVALPLELKGTRNAEQVARDCLQRVGLDKRLSHLPRQLSGGEQQRVALARAFACQPAVLFADEPTGNLDAGTGERINELLFNLNVEFGSTLVLVTHEQTLAGRCDRIIQLEAGKLVGGTQHASEPVAH